MTDARVEVIRRLARRGVGPALERALAKSRPEDIAEALRHLAPAEARRVVGPMGDDARLAEVLTHLDEATLNAVVDGLDFDRLVRLLEMMEADDEADVIERLPEALRERVLEALAADEQRMVEDLMAWPEDSAGGIMQPLAFRLREDTTCRQAIEALHEQQEDLEMVFYLYVENAAGQLVGVCSLRALLIHPPSTPLRDIMTTDVIAVSPETDQEEVARLASRYDLLAIPVVDEGRRLLGIVTIDDVVDVIKEEAIEDMMLMAGVSEGGSAESGEVGVIGAVRRRLGWLLVAIAGGVAMAELVDAFGATLARRVVLAGFIPVILGMGGNVAVQAATVTVRNLAAGHAGGSATFRLVFRETRVGLVIGAITALGLGGYALARWPAEPLLGAAVGLSLIVSIALGATIGTLLPLGLSRLGRDPAAATGPFVTTAVDIAALLVYFASAAALLGH